MMTPFQVHEFTLGVVSKQNTFDCQLLRETEKTSPGADNKAMQQNWFLLFSFNAFLGRDFIKRNFKGKNTSILTVI